MVVSRVLGQAEWEGIWAARRCVHVWLQNLRDRRLSSVDLCVSKGAAVCLQGG